MKTDLIKYLKPHFPQSNLRASFCEVWADYELNISTWLGYGTHSKQEIERVTALAIQLFEDMFLGEKGSVWALINQWDTRRDIYTFNQFNGLNEADYETWISFDETHQEDREQILIETALDNINYQNLIRSFIERNYNHDPDVVTCRVFFINPRTHMYYLHFDSEVILGSEDVSKLVTYYHKYYQHIHDGRKRVFEQYLP